MQTKAKAKLSPFERVGIVTVSTLAAAAGMLCAMASAIPLAPVFTLIFPGLRIGTAVAAVFGDAAGVVACGLANGAFYGLLLYWWYQLTWVPPRSGKKMLR